VRDNHPIARSLVQSYTGCFVNFAGSDELPDVSSLDLTRLALDSTPTRLDMTCSDELPDVSYASLAVCTHSPLHSASSSHGRSLPCVRGR
jgi:hypothetical protein